MKITRSHWTTVAMLAAFLGLVALGQHYSPQLLPKADVTGLADPGCDLLKTPCAATLPDGGRLEFTITPRPIKLLQPMRLEVAVTGLAVRKLAVDFNGESMNMGLNRSDLPATSQGHFAGETTLSVCVSGGMTWVATVMLETDRQRISVPYRFHVGP